MVANYSKLQPYIQINGRKLQIEIVVDTKTIAGVVHPIFVDARVAEGTLSEQCEDCGTDIAESMQLDSNDADTKRWITCEACGTKYPIKEEAR